MNIREIQDKLDEIWLALDQAGSLLGRATTGVTEIEKILLEEDYSEDN